ncbi:hypothetical protein K7432_000840 [Basidiobolus ranarum]|uniref:Uncharacterized protein n=1 Tax=Basidiobolus ranarum TaxID=34480 RepID=A0ABR2WAH5_9FUNG
MCVGDPPEWVKCVDPEPIIKELRETKSLEVIGTDCKEMDIQVPGTRRRTLDV